MNYKANNKIFPFVSTGEWLKYFIEVKDIEEATHWIPTFDERFPLVKFKNNCIEDSRVTIGKPYKLTKDTYDGEYEIIDNTGKNVNLPVAHHGFFVKFKTKNLIDLK